MRLQTHSKIERILVFDLERQHNRTIISWLIVNGWKELVPESEGLIEQVNLDDDDAALSALFSNCQGQFDTVLTPLSIHLDRIYELLKKQSLVITITTEEATSPFVQKIRRGSRFEPVYVTSRGCSNLHAAVLIRDMYGSETMPHLLQRVSERCRSR